MATQPPSEIDPQQIEKAETLWANFGFATKWGVILVCLLLIGMAATLL